MNSEISFNINIIYKIDIKNFIKSFFINICETNKHCSINNYCFFNNLIIGEGAYGWAPFGIEIYNKFPLAIKRLKYYDKDVTYKKEQEIIKKLNNNKIYPKFYDVKLDKSNAFLIIIFL